MNKRTAQAFAFGILFSVLFLIVGNSATAKQDKSFTVSNAKQYLKEKGFIILSSREFEDLQHKAIADKDSMKTEPSKAKTDSSQKEIAEKESQKVKKPEEKKVNKSTIVIASGMTPYDVAVMLKSLGVIEDEKKFEQFLIDKGYHTKVQIGTFEVTDEMDFVQIAKVITKS